MKTLRHILNSVVWIVLGIYVCVSVTLRIPAIQRYMGGIVAETLSNTLGAKVTIGNVDLGFMGRLIVDDFQLYDQSGKPMLRAARLSVGVDLLPLTEGRVSISSAQLFGLKAQLYKKDAASQPNFMFVVDSLASRDTTSQSRLDVRINSFIVRHGTIAYDQYDKPYTPSRLNPHHLRVSDISGHIVLRALTNDMLSATIKKLSLKEQSGLDVRRLSLSLYADQQTAFVKDFHLALPGTVLEADSIGASYTLKDGTPDLATLTASGSLTGKKISPSDFLAICPPLRHIKEAFSMSTTFQCQAGRLQIPRLTISSQQKDFLLSLSGSKTITGTNAWSADIGRLYVGDSFMPSLRDLAAALEVTLPQPLQQLSRVDISGKAEGRGDDVSGHANLLTNVGDMELTLQKNGARAAADLTAKDIDLGTLLQSSDLGKLTAKVHTTASVSGTQLQSIDVDGQVQELTYRNYKYSGIDISGTYAGGNLSLVTDVDNPGCSLALTASIDRLTSQMPHTQLALTVRELAPQRLGLSSKWGGAVFSLAATADATGKDFRTLSGKMSVRHFTMTHDAETYTIDSLSIDKGADNLSVASSFGTVDIFGRYDFSALGDCLSQTVKRHLPSMPYLSAAGHGKANCDFSITADVSDTEWVERLLGVPLHAGAPIKLNGYMGNGDINLILSAPSIQYDGGQYSVDRLELLTVGDTLDLKGSVRKRLAGGSDIVLDINAAAAHDRLTTAIGIDINSDTHIRGQLNSAVRFFGDATGNTVSVDFLPSTFMIKDTVWNVGSSNITFNKSDIRVNHFAIENGEQHLRIDGLATRSATDSICVDLQDVNVAYILDLVDFHSVEFSGQASGKAYLKSVLQNPEAWADLTVRNFRFQDGRMGTLLAHADWNNEENQVNIHARAVESDEARTLINGYISPRHNYIDLDIEAQNTNIEFAESFTGSFMNNIRARANGAVKVYGDLSEVNMTGLLTVDGSVHMKTLGTDYDLRADVIRFIPDEIIFENDTVYDRSAGRAIVTGALHHKHLTRLTYDIFVDADHMLCYDFPDYGDETFYGTVYASGRCSIVGRPHSIVINADMTPHRNSFIEYNAASPDGIANQEFITWTSGHHDSSSKSVADSLNEATQAELNASSDLHLNITANTTPDFTLRVLMDNATGDKISLNGSGVIKASYFNKGSFDMYGNYLIDHGTYKLTIQNIIKKDFTFQQGSTIVFGGDPFNARLGLKAIYQVNGVSLADLNVGNSFSNNNVRVDCIMNIAGTPENIMVDFDFDMPTVGSDAKQMIRSLITSEEELNQQVVYLLAIGRFYTTGNNNSAQDDNQQSQTSLAMQSLLSGTITQQINNILGTVVNNNNWNFGANISTGTEGFNNAEYEGLLSGRMFSNRLLINGQFGYRDNANATTSFIGDFDIRYLLRPNGNLAIKVYNQTNDRYFTKSSLNTQGLGLLIKRDFNSWRELFSRKKK